MKADRFARALGHYRAAVGRAHVHVDRRTRDRVGRATFATHQAVAAVVRPANRKQVQACLRIASRLGTPVYPISRGKNWGYGSQVPITDGSVVLDLSRMNRILSFDEQLAVITVEPGVTFRQVHRFLKRRRSRLMLNYPSTTPEASLIGNALERGLGFGPHADRALHVCNLEVVLSTGEVLRTGIGDLPHAAAADLYRWGVGPSLDGLFSQSNLGVVTRLSSWLTPIPEHFLLVQGTIDSQARAGVFIESLRELFLKGAIHAPFKLFNDYRVIGSAVQFPFGAASPTGSLARSMLRRNAVPRWRIFAVLPFASAAERRVGATRLQAVLGAAVKTLKLLDERHDFSQSPIDQPTGSDVRLAYFRKRSAPPPKLDPDRDGCGTIWCNAAVPLRRRDVARATAIVERVVFQHGFEPMIGFTFLDARIARMAANIVYDREVEGDDARALACHDEVMSELMAAGYYPFRLGVQSMGRLPWPKEHADVLDRIKRVFDPNSILARGRYVD